MNVVFERGRSPLRPDQDWTRFTLVGYPQFRIGLETTDEDEAHEKASYIYMETKTRAENGLLTGNASFDKLAQNDEYILEEV